MNDFSNKNQTVKVYLRIRPPTSEYTYIDDIDSNKTTIQITKDFEIRKFQFDRIFIPNDTNLTVNLNTCTEVLKGVVRGYNGCILAYGQTGSGKTFTIVGDSWVQGILQYSFAYLLSLLKKDIKLELCCMQVYMNHVYDLLEDEKTSNKL